MIDDFSPARTSLAAGVVVKQNLLERNRQAPPSVSQETSSLDGLIKPQARDYSTGSSDTPAYSFVSGSSIYTYKGGTGGTFESFNTEFNAPVSSSGEPYSGLTKSQRVSSSFAHRYPAVTQSFSQSVDTPSGSVVVRRIDQREFYDGDFQPQDLDVGINEICKAYFGQDNLLDLTYKIQWFDSSSFDETLFLSSSQHPAEGNAWLWSEKEYSGTPITGSGHVEYIKISTTSANGENISNFITSADSITFRVNGAQDIDGNILYGPQTWQINSAVIQGDSALIYVNPALSSKAVNSLDDISFDFSFSASGLFSWESTSSGADPYVTRSIGITSSIPQGYFPPLLTIS